MGNTDPRHFWQAKYFILLLSLLLLYPSYVLGSTLCERDKWKWKVIWNLVESSIKYISTWIKHVLATQKVKNIDQLSECSQQYQVSGWWCFRSCSSIIVIHFIPSKTNKFYEHSPRNNSKYLSQRGNTIILYFLNWRIHLLFKVVEVE